jgi:hypothetical protein
LGNTQPSYFIIEANLANPFMVSPGFSATEGVTMRFTGFLAAIFALVLCSAAHAQVVPSTTGTTYLAVVQTGAGGVCVSGFSSPCVSPSIGIPLNNYATSADVASQFATVNAQLATHGNQINTLTGQVVSINGQITTQSGQIATANGQISTLNGQLANQATQVAALNIQATDLVKQLANAHAYVAAVGAMHDAIPDPGDRFAVRLNSAEVNGVVAAGFSASANLGNGFRASITYAGASGGSAVSGGLNFSIH